ncbi:phosphoribosylformylglycinamidine synthase subunit PurQ [Euzebya sp.]|uniref:phosphoribosylformylglycinamidine synthase subunit PurQ n=1 Tax=Euzebya sp. TaxID=1971409 RepID=UPI00351173B5
MRIGILRFPGTCDDRDSAYAIRTIGHEPVVLWHGDADLQGVEAVVVPGGFSYGDYLRAGAIARFSPAMRSVAQLAADGGRVLGICNGFQVLCEAGLLPGALTRNVGLRFTHRLQHLRDEATGRVLAIPLKNGEGRYVHPDPTALAAGGQVLARYCEPDGAVTDAANPNGSVAGIAGVTNTAGNVAGLMPHPEHAVDALVGWGSTDGRGLLLERLIGQPVPA